MSRRRVCAATLRGASMMSASHRGHGNLPWAGNLPRAERGFLLAVGVVALVATGCTSGSSPAQPPVHVTTTRTLTPTPSSGLVPAGPLTQAAGSCPYLDVGTARDDIGIRLGRQLVLSAGGKPVGCKFFADQNPTYVASEHLPGPNQPVLEIDSSRYSEAAEAHAAAIKIGAAGGNAHAVTVSPTLSGVSFQTLFDPADGASDWAFVFNVGSTVVTVTTAQSNVELNARTIAAAIATKF
jgi:hypothetical protein